MSVGSSQINVRVPSTLRDKGNATLSLVNSSPTKIIREVWSMLAQGAEAYERLHEALVAESSRDVAEDTNRRMAELERATNLFDEFSAGMDLNVLAFVPLDDEQTQEALYDEFLESES